MSIDFWENGVTLGSIFRQKVLCCTLIELYSIYSTVGQSIASISDLGSIFTSAQSAEVNMSLWV